MGDLGKLIVAKDFKKLPKVQKIATSGHTACFLPFSQMLPPLLASQIPPFCLNEKNAAIAIVENGTQKILVGILGTPVS